MTIAEILKSAAQLLSERGIAEPRREANSLLALALEKNQTFLIAHDDYQLSAEEKKRFDDFLRRRANREPLQYIRGTQEFYGLDFIVTPDVLIPRPETELIVENALEILKKTENSRFCEIGVGSGCISISILHALKNSAAVGLDISEKALQVAELNAVKNFVSDRIRLEISDVFTALPQNEKFDLIVSNPPYISAAEMESLQTEVRDFEPASALTDGRDGFSIIEKIISGAPDFLRSNGFLVLEIGFGQAAKVAEMFAKNVWQEVVFLTDLQDIPRTIKAQIANYK